ncbi:MAG: zinc-finger-containing protein [Blastocatellales bacterium]
MKECPYCGEPIVVVHSSVIYGKNAPDYGIMRACRDYPKCDSYGGTTVASKELRGLRKQCHKEFDAWWQSGKKTRANMYRWLCRTLKKSREQGHIALLREEDCKKLLEALATKT